MASPQRNLNPTIQNITPSSQEHCERDEVHRIMREKNVSSLRNYGGAPKVAAAFNSNIEEGLQTGTALKAGLKQVDHPSFTSFVLEEFKSATLLPLFVSALICFIAGIVSKKPDYGWPEGVDILVNILILVFLPSIQKYYSARNDAKKISLQKVTVRRDGKHQDLAVSEVEEGDLVVLKEGDVVPGDGLFVFGDELVIDDGLHSRIDCNNNPFLLSGSTVLKGGGRMIVVSIGSNTSLGEMMLLVNRNPCEEPSFQAHMKELNRTMDYIVMFIYIVLASVLFFRLLYTRNHHKDDHKSVQPPNLNNKVSAEFVETLFKKVLLRSRGKIIRLIYSLTIVDLGLQGILPPTISASLICWNRSLKKKYQIHPKNLYACGTMGLTTIVVIDVSNGLLVPQCPLEAAKALKNKEVPIVLVTRGDENFVRAIADEIGILLTSKDLVVNGEEFDQDVFTRKDLISVRIMYKSQPKHTLLLVKALRENGHVVAYLGGLATTLDTAALKEAGIGIIEERVSCRLAHESSDFIVQGEGSLLPLLTSGRFVYSNVVSFIEALHTTSICILFMAFILEPFHLIWVNAVTHILGFSMILMELPKKRTISLKARAMCPNIARKALCQVLLLLSLGFIQKTILGSNEDTQEVMTLNILTMFQVFYMFQIMEFLDMEVLTVAVRNYSFLATVGVIMVVHGIIINCTENLSFVNWTVCFLLVLLLWVLDSTLKFVAKTLTEVFEPSCLPK